MATYFMYGKYSAEAVKSISSGRTKRAKDLIKKFGGDLCCIYALLGKYDIVLIANFPKVEDVMKASLALTKLSGIAFATLPAVPVEDFDKFAAKV